MTWPLVVALVLGLGLLVALGYWLVMEAEFAYLGPGPVRRLYNWGARDYDRIKAYDPLEEFAFLGRPLLDRLELTAGSDALVLDLGTGTGRMALALLNIPFFTGTVVGIDLSPNMLRHAADKSLAIAERYPLLLGSACPLPFADATFDAVTMLEVLELLPDRDKALREAQRVLRPGGYLLLSNRIGWHATLMPWRTDTAPRLRERLRRLGWQRVHILPWQNWYDLAWARKPGRLGRRTDHRPWRDFLTDTEPHIMRDA
jgi:ubiquinone/menaquinone biosynthesis C-methylase UbiE